MSETAVKVVAHRAIKNYLRKVEYVLKDQIQFI